MNNKRITPLNTIEFSKIKEYTLQKYSHNYPRMNWQEDIHYPLKWHEWYHIVHLIPKQTQQPKKDINICFCDESAERRRMSIIIEIDIPSITKYLSKVFKIIVPFLNNTNETSETTEKIQAIGLFFERDCYGYVNLLYKTIINNHEHNIIYKKCNYFGLEPEYIRTNTKQTSYTKESRFIISNEWQDKALFSGVNFYHKYFCDFHYIVDHINDFIQHSLLYIQNPEYIIAYPKLKCINTENGIRICIRTNEEYIAEAQYNYVPIISNNYITIDTENHMKLES